MTHLEHIRLTLAGALAGSAALGIVSLDLRGIGAWLGALLVAVWLSTRNGE